MDGVHRTRRGGSEPVRGRWHLESGPLTGPERRNQRSQRSETKSSTRWVAGAFCSPLFSGALYLDGRLHIMGAGDSRFFLVGLDSVEQLTGQSRRLSPCGRSPKAIGAAQRPPTLVRTEVEIQPGSRLVLATDGVTDNVLVSELAGIVRAAATPEEAAERVNSLVEERINEGQVPEQLGPPLPARRPHRDLPLLPLVAVVDGPVAHASVRIRKPDTCSGFRKLLQFICPQSRQRA